MNETIALCLEIIFWLALFIVFYTYLGYGIVLYVLVKIGRVERAFREACKAFVTSIGRRPAGNYPLHYGIQRRRCSGREDGKQS